MNNNINVLTNFNNNIYNNNNNNNNNYDVLKSNYIILKSIAESIKSSYGPNGSSKIIVDEKLKSVIISSDGYVILKYFDIKHPVGKLIKQHFLNNIYLLYGGLSTSLLLSCYLMENAINLLHRGLDLNSILKGYQISLKYALEYLDELDLIKVDIYNNNNNNNDKDIYKTTKNHLLDIFNIIIQKGQSNNNSINNNSNINNDNSNNLNSDYKLLKNAIADVILQYPDFIDFESRIKSIHFSTDNLYNNFSNNISNNNDDNSILVERNNDDEILKYTSNESLIQLQAIENGYIFDLLKPCSHIKEIQKEPKILFLNCSLTREASNLQIQVEFNNPDKLLAWKVDEENYLKELVRDLAIRLKVNTIISTGNIDSIALDYINQFNILAFKLVPLNIFNKLVNNNSNNNISNNNEIIIHNLDSKFINNNNISKNYDKIIKYNNNNNNKMNNILKYYFKIKNNNHNDSNNQISNYNLEQKTIIIQAETIFYAQQMKRYCEDLLMALNFLSNNNNLDNDSSSNSGDKDILDILNFLECDAIVQKEFRYFEKIFILGMGSAENQIAKKLLEKSVCESSQLKYPMEGFSLSLNSISNILQVKKTKLNVSVNFDDVECNIDSKIYDNYYLKRKQFIDSFNLINLLFKVNDIIVGNNNNK